MRNFHPKTRVAVRFFSSCRWLHYEECHSHKKHPGGQVTETVVMDTKVVAEIEQKPTRGRNKILQKTDRVQDGEVYWYTVGRDRVG